MNDVVEHDCRACGEHEMGGPRAVPRSLALFRELTQKSEGLRLIELMRILDIPKSSLLNLLQPLVVDGYLSRNRGLYRLGPKAFGLAVRIMSGWELSKLARPYLEELAHCSQETVYLGVLDRHSQMITCVDAIDSLRSTRYAVRIGMSQPLSCTAAGRVLLAFSDRRFQDSYLRRPDFSGNPANAPTERTELRAALKRIRRTGLDVYVGQPFNGSASIAAPIHATDSNVIAAIAVGAPRDRFELTLPQLRAAVLDVAAKLSGQPRRHASSAARTDVPLTG